MKMILSFRRRVVVLAITLDSIAVLAQSPGLNANVQPAELENVTIEQKLDEQIPLHLAFRDETGRNVALREYFDKRPVILALVYYECPMLCNLVLNGLVRSLTPLSFDAGKEFEVIAVSINPKEQPALADEKKRVYLKQYNRPGSEAGWHFLTGEQQAIEQLAEAVGFRYVYDPETGLYAHAGGVMVLTPEGRLARYFYGIEYASNDLRFALMEAAANRIGTPVDQLLLYCFHYDPATGKYGLVIMNVMRLAGLATVLCLGTFMLVMFGRDRRAKLLGSNHPR